MSEEFLTQNRPTVVRTPAEEELIDGMYRQKAANEWDKPFGFVTLGSPIPYGTRSDQDPDPQKHKGPWAGGHEKVIPAGTTMRIVMVSRMGDCGLSDNLEATHGYEIRFNWDDAVLTDIRLTKEPTNV